MLRALIAAEPPPTRHALSREFCRRIGWLKPDGGLKDMMARVTMLAMHRDGLIALPPPKQRQSRPGPIAFGPDTEPPLFPAPTSLDEVRPLDLRPVGRGTREGKLWNEFIARYHYLGYKTLVGAQMRYAVHDHNGWHLAMLGLLNRRLEARPPRQVHRMDARAAREEPPPRRRQPEVPHPALDHDPPISARTSSPSSAGVLLLDWAERYNITPVLIETFVEMPRYTGAVYRASGWIHVGTTQGRGRYDRQKQFDKPKKDVWLRPLRKDWKRTLNR